MKNLLVFLATAALCIALQGCTLYTLSHTEDGMETRITALAPPGSKVLTDGKISMGVDESGQWSLDMGERGQSDLTGTALMIDSILARALSQASQMGALQTQNEGLLQLLQQARQPAASPPAVGGRP